MSIKITKCIHLNRKFYSQIFWPHNCIENYSIHLYYSRILFLNNEFFFLNNEFFFLDNYTTHENVVQLLNSGYSTRILNAWKHLYWIEWYTHGCNRCCCPSLWCCCCPVFCCTPGKWNKPCATPLRQPWYAPPWTQTCLWKQQSVVSLDIAVSGIRYPLKLLTDRTYPRDCTLRLEFIYP